MGARGPAPRGNSGTPKFIVCRPQKPSYLTKLASEYWDFVVPMLERGKVLNESHGHLLYMLCEAQADVIMYREQLNKVFESGRMPVSMGSGGSKKEHPVIKLLDRATKQYIEIAKTFGMTPMSIGRVEIGEMPRQPRVVVAKEEDKNQSSVEQDGEDDFEDDLMADAKEMREKANEDTRTQDAKAS